MRIITVKRRKANINDDDNADDVERMKKVFFREKLLWNLNWEKLHHIGAEL